MGYLSLVILIGVIAWTLWRFVNHRRLPLNTYQSFDERNEMNKDNTNQSDDNTKMEEQNKGTSSKN